MHRSFRQPAGSQPGGQARWIVESDFHGYTLLDFHEIAGDIFRRRQREHRPCAALQALHMAAQMQAGEAIEEICTLWPGCISTG